MRDDKLFEELKDSDPTLAKTLEEPAGAAKLLVQLPERFQPQDVTTEESLGVKIWDLVGRNYIVRGRLYEALGVFWSLYQQMLMAQTATHNRVHKGMPLVRIADCYTQLGFYVHAKRYLMLTLCEDALSSQGHVSPETTGVYFRLVWGYGLSNTEIDRFATRFHQLALDDPELAFYPEAVLLELEDDSWMTEYPQPAEAFVYRINPAFLRSLMLKLGNSAGLALERVAHYLMSCMPGCRTKRRARSGSTDYDLVCSIEGFDVDYRSELGRYFVCECKDWEQPADFTAFAKFCRVLDSIKSRFGILFSSQGISGEGRRQAAQLEQIKVFQDRGIVIVVLDRADLDRTLNGVNLINLLRNRYEAVRLDFSNDRGRN